MLLKWSISFVTFAMLSLNSITESDCDGLKNRERFSKSNQNPEPNLSFLELLLDYLGLGKIRERIDQLFHNDELRFIGQSLAWVGQSMVIKSEFIPHYHSQTRTISLVPFSGNFFRITNTNMTRLNLNDHVRKHENLPTKEELEKYRNFLRGFGLDPRSIVERSTNGRRTVIVKKIKDCINLMSFLDIIFNWARHEGIHPDRLRTALKVFVVTLNLTDSEVPSTITDGEFTVDVFSMNVDSISDTIQRTAYPERYGGYVRLVTNYPPQIWNEPPPEFDVEHEGRRRTIVEKLRDIVQRMVVTFATSPTLALRSSCTSRRRRIERDLSNQDILMEQFHLVWTLNKDLIENLRLDHDESSNEISFDDFFEDQLEDSSSVVSKILDRACEDVVVESDQVHFSQSKGKIFSCFKHHRLFHCNEEYETSALVRKIATSAAKIFCGRDETVQNIGEEAKNLIYGLVNPHPELPVEFLSQATRDAALFCSNEKIVSSMECPFYERHYLGEIMLTWFV